MSGGKFDYAQHRIQDIIDSIEEIIETNDVVDWHKFSPETLQEFQNGIIALQKAYIYAQRIDWLVSADDGEENFHERLKEDLQASGFDKL